MTFVRPRARILELSTTVGGGPLALAGAADNSFNTFSSFMAVGDTTYATVVEPTVAFWTGIVTYSAVNQITLTAVEESKGTFGAGTKEIMATAMASTATFREDIAGAIVTGGTSTAYTVASYRKYRSLAELDGNIVAFSPHTGNGQGPSLAVDGLAAKPLRSSPGFDIGSNVLIEATPYTALYNHTAGEFYLHGLGGNAYGIPLGAGMDYWLPIAPSSAFAFPAGQQISRTTYAALFAQMGTMYGAGDGSTTFNLPDKRGRVSAAFDNGNATSRLNTGGMNAASLGSAGGEQTHVLTTTELAAHSHASTLTDPGHQHSYNLVFAALAAPGGGGPSLWQALTSPTVTGSNTTGISINNASAGGGGAHNNIQPTIVCNYIMRVL